jgi:hypothetical protein
MTDEGSTIFERRIDGSLLRQFGGHVSYAYGVTRAINGDVYVTGQFTEYVARYNSSGVLLGKTLLSPYVARPINIVQVAVPEPASALMLIVALLATWLAEARSRHKLIDA